MNSNYKAITGIVISAILGMLVGAYNYASILSCLSNLHLLKDKTPETFVVPINDVPLIYNYSRNDPNWNGSSLSNIRAIYCDSVSYYVLGDSEAVSCPTLNSYYAKQFGVRIHGRTGLVYNKSSQRWSSVGYCAMTRKDFQQIVKSEMSSIDVERAVGKSYSQINNIFIQGAPPKTTWREEYRCLDGDIAVILTNNSIVVEVCTNDIKRAQM